MNTFTIRKKTILTDDLYYPSYESFEQDFHIPKSVIIEKAEFGDKLKP